MRGIFPKRKKAVSELISYSLLIVIAIAASVLVYSYLKVYVPKDNPTCPDGISILVTDYACNLSIGGGANLTIDFMNKGTFNIDAAYIRIGTPGSTTNMLINGAQQQDLYFIPTLSPNQQVFSKSFQVDSSIISSAGNYNLEVEPAVTDPTTNNLNLCSSSVISQTIQCG